MALFHAILQALTAIGVFFGGLAGVWAIVRGWPKYLDHARTLRMLDASMERERAAIERERIAATTAENYRLAAESWQARYEAQMAQLAEIQSAQVATLDEMRETKDDLAAALIYITDVIRHFSAGGSVKDIPPMPESLDAVVRSLLEQKPQATA